MEKKYYNLSQIEELSGGDNDFKKELITIFLEQMPEFLTNMEKFLEEKDWEKLGKEAHTAKSSVLIFGMKNAGQNLKDVQNLCEARNTDSIPGIFLQIKEEITTTIHQLKKVLDEL